MFHVLMMINVKSHLYAKLVYAIVIKHHITILDQIHVNVLDIQMNRVQLTLNVYNQLIVQQQHANVHQIIILTRHHINASEKNL